MSDSLGLQGLIEQLVVFPSCLCLCQHLFILPISSTGYTMAVESSPAGPTALVPLGDPD